MKKTCRLEVLDEGYKDKAKKKKSNSFPKIISFLFLILFVILIILKSRAMI
jgi:uncharacterized membrane protein (DUF485 family)